MSFLDRYRKPVAPADGPISYARLEIPYKQLVERGWPRNLQVVRKTLPEHLHNCRPSGAARYGSWIVVANVGRTPVGVAWTVHSAGDSTGASIEEVAVIESHRRRGIATQLLRETARWMTELQRPNLSILPLTGSGWVVKAGFQPAHGGSYVADARRIAYGQSEQ